MEIKNTINYNNFLKKEKRDSNVNLTNKDFDNLKKFIDKHYAERFFNDLDKYHKR